MLNTKGIAQTIPYPLELPLGWSLANNITDYGDEYCNNFQNIVIQDYNDDGINDVIAFLKKDGNKITMAFISDTKTRRYKQIMVTNATSDYLSGNIEDKLVVLGICESHGIVYQWKNNSFIEYEYE